MSIDDLPVFMSGACRGQKTVSGTSEKVYGCES